MYGQMKRYKESLKNTPEPVLLSQMDQQIDLRGLLSYAKDKGVSVSELNEQEKQAFVHARNTQRPALA